MKEEKIFIGIDPGSPEGDYSHDYTIQKDGDTTRIEIPVTREDTSGRTLTVRDGEVISDSQQEQEPSKKTQVRDSRGQIYEYTREGLIKLGQAFVQPDPETGEPQTYLFKIEKPRSKKDRKRAKQGKPYQTK